MKARISDSVRRFPLFSGNTHYHKANHVRKPFFCHFADASWSARKNRENRRSPHCTFHCSSRKVHTSYPKYALSPSYDNQQPRELFDYGLGMVTRKFAKYQGDIRYKQYVNTGNNTLEGMFFLEGKIANSAVSGGYAKNPDNQYVIYLRDQVGRFEGNAESGYILH